MEKPEEAFTYRDAGLDASETLAAFRKRQDEDVIRRRKPFVQRVEAKLAREDANEDGYEYGYGEGAEYDEEVPESRNEHDEESIDGSQSGEEGWRNSEGERLKDFGVDEDIEFYDERDDDVPLSQLLARRKERMAR